MTLRFIPDHTKIPFMNASKFVMAFSLITSLICVALLFTKGLNYGVDFVGGTVMELQSSNAQADVAKLRANLGHVSHTVEVQEFGAPNIVLIRLGDAISGTNIAEQVKAEIGAEYSVRRVETVGARVSSELIETSFYAVIIATLLILIYLWFRFEWQFAVAAVLATLHDIILTLGFFSLSGLEFNLTSIAAILTILGYSLNDTVVVFDRIREMLRRFKKMDLHEVIDISINSTLSRTINTHVTTTLALLALVFLGGDVIFSFSAAMLFGVVVGTYSSICVASPLLMLFNLRADQAQAPVVDVK